MLLGAGLLVGPGGVLGQGGPAPIASSPPRLLDLEAQATPLPPPGGPKVIAATGATAAPGPAPPVPTAPPRPAPGPVRPVAYQPPDPEPPSRDEDVLPNGLLSGAVSAPRAPAAGRPASVTPPTPPAGAGGAGAVRSGAAVGVEVLGLTQTTPGQPVPLEIVVRNTGAAELARVRVETPLPPGVRVLGSEPPGEAQGERLAWGLGGLEVGGERRLRVELQPVATGELTLAPTVTFTPAAGLRTPVAPAPFSVTLSGPEAVAPGAKATLRVRVANNASAPLNKVIVRVHLPPGLAHPSASPAGDIDAYPFALAPGANKVLPLELTATQSGRLVVTASARADDRQETPPARAVVTVTGRPLALRLDAPRQAVAGRDLDVRIEVANPHAAPVAGVRLVQSVAPGLEVVAASAGAVPVPGGQGLAWALGTLAPGQRQVLTCTLRPRATGDWPLYAVLTADQAGEARASHAVHIDAGPPLALEVMTRDDALAVGSETVCEVRVLNTSDRPATGVRLTAWLSGELEPFEPQGPTAARAQPPQVWFEPLERLAAHAEAVYRVRLRGRQPGQGRCRIELTAEQLASPVVQEAGALVQGDPVRTAGFGTGPGGR
jgi:hypothetical protein